MKAEVPGCRGGGTSLQGLTPLRVFEGRGNKALLRQRASWGGEKWQTGVQVSGPGDKMPCDGCPTRSLQLSKDSTVTASAGDTRDRFDP